MSDFVDLAKYPLYLMLILPGIVSMQVYRFMMPARSIDWKVLILEPLFYSSINIVLSTPIIIKILSPDYPSLHPIHFYIYTLLILFIFPIAEAVIFVRVRASSWVIRHFQLPYAVAWDYYFNKRNTAFILVKMKDGTSIGGYFGTNSYATTYPDHGDLYLQTVYELDDKNEFGNPYPYSRGCIIPKESIAFIELFDVPDENDQINVNSPADPTETGEIKT